MVVVVIVLVEVVVVAVVRKVGIIFFFRSEFNLVSRICFAHWQTIHCCVVVVVGSCCSLYIQIS